MSEVISKHCERPAGTSVIDSECYVHRYK